MLLSVSFSVSIGKISLLVPASHLHISPLHHSHPSEHRQFGHLSLSLLSSLVLIQFFFLKSISLSVSAITLKVIPLSHYLSFSPSLSLHLLAQPYYFLNCRFSLIYANTHAFVSPQHSLVSLWGSGRKTADFKLLRRAKLMGFFHYALLLLLFTQKYNERERERDTPHTKSFIYFSQHVLICI